MRSLKVVIGACGLLMAANGWALADQIGIAGATGTVTFTNEPGGIDFTTTGFTATGTASFQHPTGVPIAIGNATFGPESGTITPGSPGIFAIITGALDPFHFGGCGDLLDGTIVWAGI